MGSSSTDDGFSKMPAKVSLMAFFVGAREVGVDQSLREIIIGADRVVQKERDEGAFRFRCVKGRWCWSSDWRCPGGDPWAGGVVVWKGFFLLQASILAMNLIKTFSGADSFFSKSRRYSIGLARSSCWRTETKMVHNRTGSESYLSCRSLSQRGEQSSISADTPYRNGHNCVRRPLKEQWMIWCEGWRHTISQEKSWHPSPIVQYMS